MLYQLEVVQNSKSYFRCVNHRLVPGKYFFEWHSHRSKMNSWYWQNKYMPDTGKDSGFWKSFVPGTHFYRQKTKYTKPAPNQVPTTKFLQPCLKALARDRSTHGGETEKTNLLLWWRGGIRSIFWNTCACKLPVRKCTELADSSKSPELADWAELQRCECKVCARPCCRLRWGVHTKQHQCTNPQQSCGSDAANTLRFRRHQCLQKRPRKKPWTRETRTGVVLSRGVISPRPLQTQTKWDQKLHFHWARCVCTIFSIRPHVQAWLSWSERGTVNP